MNIPNCLSLIRIGVIPFFVVLVMNGHMIAAVILFSIGILTDALDGIAARVLNQVSPYGSFLDPLADKLLLATSFVTLGLIGSMNWWIVVLVIGREVIITTGWLIVRHLHLQGVWVQPTLLGKITIASQMITVFAALLNFIYTSWVIIIMIALILMATVDYIVKEITKFLRRAQN